VQSQPLCPESSLEGPLGGLLGSVGMPVQCHKLIGSKRNHSISYAIWFCELDFKDTRLPLFHNRTNLTTSQVMFRKVVQ
jgi:hypothetical protein